MTPFRDPFQWHESFGRYLLTVRTGGYCVFDNPPTNGRHSHDFYEICLITAGHGRYIHGDSAYALHPGDVILALPGVTHEIESRESRDLQLVFFSFEIHKGQVPHPAGEPERLISAIQQPGRLHAGGCRRLLGYLQVVARDLPPDWILQRTLATFLTEMLSMIAPPATGIRPGPEKSVVDRALDIIDQRIREPLHVREVARSVGLSERSLRRYFDKILNKTVVEVIRERKLNRSTALLLMNFDVASVARMLSMEGAHFSRAFKRQFGVSPRDYQASYE